MPSRPCFRILLAALAALILAATAARAAEPKPEIKLYTLPRQPMVMKVKDNLEGFYVDLWGVIARQAGYESTMYLRHSQAEVLKALETGEAQAAIGYFGMDPDYLDKVNYSYPILNTGLQIMVLRTGKSMVDQVLADALEMLLTPYILLVMCFMVVIALAAGHVIWLVERGRNPEFPQTYLKGVGAGVWWAVVTLSTVGYGDKKPATHLGRLFSMAFILVGTLLLAGFVSTFTAKLTLKQIGGSISSFADLRGRTVGTLTDTSYLDYLRENKIKLVLSMDVDQAVKNLLDGKVEALVLQDEQLQRFVSKQGGGRFQIVGSVFNKASYAVAFPKKSPYLNAVNRAILEIRANGVYEAIYQRWFTGQPPAESLAREKP